MSSAERQRRRREVLDEVAAELGYDSHYKMLTALINGEVEVRKMRKFTIVERTRDGGNSEYEAYAEDETYLVQENAGILQGGGTIFRSQAATVHAASRDEALDKFYREQE